MDTIKRVGLVVCLCVVAGCVAPFYILVALDVLGAFNRPSPPRKPEDDEDDF